MNTREAFDKWWSTVEEGIELADKELLRSFAYMAFIEGREDGVRAMWEHWMNYKTSTAEAMEKVSELL